MLITLGLAGVVEGIECTMDTQCVQPTAACREAVCDGATNACVQTTAADQSPCSTDGGAVGRCQQGQCIPDGVIGG